MYELNIHLKGIVTYSIKLHNYDGLSGNNKMIENVCFKCDIWKTFPDVFLTEYEQEKQKLENAPDSHKECPPEAKVILSVVDQYLGADHYDK